MEYKKQVSVDALLGIHQKHEITCPKINILQFDRRNSTKIYEEDLEQDPQYLKVELFELLTAINDLNTWANDIVKLVNELPEDLYNAILGNIFSYEKDYEKLINLIDTDYNSELEEYSNDINGLIEQWKEYRIELIEAKQEENIQNRLLEKEQKNLLFLKLEGHDTTDSLSLIDFYQDEVNEQKEKQDYLFNSFERYIKEDFKKSTQEFSRFLEIVRERNDDIRSKIDEIKYQILKNAKEFLNLDQPDEYLDKRFGIKSDTANLGVMFNDTEINERNETVNFATFVLGMKLKKYITFDQLNQLYDLNNTHTSNRQEKKEKIIEFLKDNKFKTIRYYQDQNDFIKSRDSFKIEKIAEEKLKIKKP